MWKIWQFLLMEDILPPVAELTKLYIYLIKTKKNPEVLENQVAGAMESDYAIFGWKVKKESY